MLAVRGGQAQDDSLGAFDVTFWWATALTMLLLGPALLLPSQPTGRPGSPDAAPQPAARNPPA